MNQRNVDALKALVASIDLRVNDGQSEELWFADIAYQLAARGVLVPSALTGGEIDEVRSYGDRASCMEALERIAKGETT